jgi:ketopantoate reductase
LAKNIFKKLKKISLIYGGGAIGSFLASCLINANHKVYFLCRGDHYNQIVRNGLNIKIYYNFFLKKKILIKKNDKFIAINTLKKIKTKKINNIFITTKINENLKKILKNIDSFIDKKSLIITPCTSIPFWWYKCLNANVQKKISATLNPLFLKNIKSKNLVGMTMWLSGKIKNPGNVVISHIQRGFPIKEVFKNKKKLVDQLRNDIRRTTLSPKVKNIFSEIFIKSINSLAFNMIALKYQQNNKQLDKNIEAKNEVLKILNEGDQILKNNKIKIYQAPTSRVIQTLKSKNHTMSMLYSFKKNKKIELKYLWLSFKKLSKQLKFNMVVTNNIYKEVKKKLDGFI